MSWLGQASCVKAEVGEVTVSGVKSCQKNDMISLLLQSFSSAVPAVHETNGRHHIW